MTIRTVTELMQIEGFEERYRYLALNGVVAHQTFGSERYLNQAFYNSSGWRRLRHEIIVRDNGCDLATPGYEIHDKIIIHHINPVVIEDLKHGISDDIINPEYLISTTHRTHNAIHYGDRSLLALPPIERRPGDHILW